MGVKPLFHDPYYHPYHYYLENKRSWRGSRSYSIWRKKVLKKAKGNCQICGKKAKLQAHHKKPYSQEFYARLLVKNGQALCANCHRQQHPWMSQPKPTKPKTILRKAPKLDRNNTVIQNTTP